MKLFLTHVGMMALKKVPLTEFIQGQPLTKSMMIAPNRYTKVVFDVNGVIRVNDILAGMLDIYYTLDKAIEIAHNNSMEIVALVEYQEISKKKGGL